MDVSVHGAIRGYNRCLSGTYFVDFTRHDKAGLFFFYFIFFRFPLCLARCNRFDVVSGCGKNAGGAVETVVFRNLAVKRSFRRLLATKRHPGLRCRPEDGSYRANK